MTYDNPFTAPQSGAGDTAASGGGTVSPLAIQYLRETRPWVVFLSVLGFIGTALIVCMGAFAMFASMLGMAGDSGPFEGGIGVLLGAFYLALGVLYLFPALFLWRYGQAISSLVATEEVFHLESALLHQRAFWRFVGILTAVGMVLYLLLAVAAVLWALLLV